MDTLIEWSVDHVNEYARLRAGFTSRHGGYSESPYDSFNLGFHVGDDAQKVQRNRNRIDSELGTQAAWMNQVHSSRVALARPGQIIDHADGLILDLHAIEGSAIAACVMVADCVPLLLLSCDEARGAVVHVGRKGFMLDIVTRAVNALDTELIAVVGPSICGSCYEVSEQMCCEAGEKAVEAVCTTSWGTPSIDVPAGIVHQLRTAGVNDIRRMDICTYEDENYYSYRRATHASDGKTGRFAGVVCIEKI